MSTTPAWAQFWAAVLPALAAFLVAALGAGGLAVRNWVQLNALRRRVDAQEDAVPPPPMVVALGAPGGGGGTAHLPLRAPPWNQLDDPLPDAMQDPQAAQNCGEECVAMAISACGGPDLPAGVLRTLLGGTARRGSTTPLDLAYLLALFSVKNHVREADPDAAWLEWQHSYLSGFLVLALGYWVTPGYLHWVLVRQTTPADVTFNDPWGGHERTLNKDEAQKLYAGVYIHIDQAVSKPAGAPPSD